MLTVSIVGARALYYLGDLLQDCAVGQDWVDVPSRQGGWRHEDHGAGQGVQRPAVHGRGDPVGRALVSDVPDQLLRSRTDAAGPWGGGRPHNPLPLDPSLCAGAGEADPAAPTPEQRLVAGRWDIRQGEGALDLLVSGGRQPRPDDRLPALGQAGRRGGETVLPQSTWAAAHRQPP